uniref:Uncharacterized protein n=1 Tax=Panagrolaimus sp. ES5 TaxID=591445 RepID=A0AC34G361_9BILA
MNTLPTDNCLSNNDSNIPAKVLSPNDPRLKEISQQIYNLLAFRNKPEVIAYDLQGYYGTNVEGLMKEYGFDKNSFQSFFTQLGYQFDSKGRFLLPSVAPTLFMTAYPRIQEIEIVSENFFTSCNNRRYLLRHEFPYHQQNDDDDEEDFPFFGDNGLNGYNGALVQPHNGQQPDVNNGFGGGGGGAADTGEIRGSDLLVIFRNLRPPPTGVKIVDDQWI